MNKKEKFIFAALEDGRIYALISLLFLVVLGTVFWPETEQGDVSDRLISDQPRYTSGNALIPPLPRPTGLDPNKVDLGKRLFSDPRLSGDNSISCANCHGLATAGVDGLNVSVGVAGRRGARNAPTVFNAALNSLQFWDGRAASLEEQLDGPINNPNEMASNWDQVVLKIEADDHYRQSFSELYADGVSIANIKNAVATFQRSLITPDSPFDRFQRGDSDAISPTAKAGYRLFRNYGCISCHQGVNVGGNMFEKIGVMKPYFDESPGALAKADLGRFHLTNIEEHRYEFRVPSLRNVSRTAPYFHDGGIAALEDAVKIMARHQLGLELDRQEIEQIVAFLESLTGEYDGAPL